MDSDTTFEERQKIEHKYQALFDHIADPILVFEQTTNTILDCNQSFIDVYGYKRDELKTMTPLDLHPEDEVKIATANIDDRFRGTSNQYTHITKSGIKMSVEVMTDETEYHGKPAWISNIRDITKRIQLEIELRKHRDELEQVVEERTHELEEEIAERRQTETKFKTLFESSSDAVVLLNEKGFIDCNQAALKIYGCKTKKKFCSYNPFDFSPSHQPNGDISKKLAMDKINEAYKTGSCHFEWVHLNIRSEKLFPADVLLTSLELNGETVLQGVIRDISKRKQSEEKLKNSEEKYRGIIENMQDVFYRTDIDQNLTMISPSGLNLLGYTPDDNLLGENISQLFYKNSAKYYQFLNALRKKGVVSNFELEIYTKKGNAIPILSSSSYYTDKMGEPLGIEGIIVNISEQKAVEGKLKKAMIEAEEATKAKSEFLANMSHEIRTPMNGIMGMVELLLDADLETNQKNLASTISSEAESLLAIINSILDFSKIEAGKFELDNIPFNLRFLFEDLSSSFAITAQKKGLEFISFLPPDAPEKLIGDPGRLRQILVNLTGNALKFTHKGEIFIWADSFKDLGDSVNLRFCVKDTGIGIPKESQDRIFESFSQADGSTTRIYGGTGLGTTISKQLVKMMNGEIGLESKPFSGSTFWFTVELKKGADFMAENENDPPTDLNQKNILVVDDNKNNRFVFCEHLKSWGCHPSEAKSGPEAISILAKAIRSNVHFDMILSDFQMPKMDGFQLVKEINKIPSLNTIPVIILTSMGMIGDSKICKELGIKGYLTKPVKRHDLKSSIISILNKKDMFQSTDSSDVLTKHAISEIGRNKTQILLAEDYPTNQIIALKHLTNAGFGVTLAENGQQAVDQCKKRQFDIILMDIQMPLVDGYEATKAIRKLEEEREYTLSKNNPDTPILHRPTPIIAMTAHAIKGYKEKCLKVGMDDYITKPLTKKDLVTMVEKWVNQRVDQRVNQRANNDKIKAKTNTKLEDSIQLDNTISETPLDYQLALEEFDNDKVFLMDVLSEFIQTVENQIPIIETAISEQNFTTIKNEAHSIKGGSANLCATPLSIAASELEEAGKSKDNTQIDLFLPDLRTQLVKLKKYVKGL